VAAFWKTIAFETFLPLYWMDEMPLPMFSQLETLILACSPPEVPEGVPTQSEWTTTFRALGGRLPEELVQLNKRYGTGFFRSRSSPTNGSVWISSRRIGEYAIQRLGELRLAKLKKPNAFPAALYFDLNGLFPVGRIGLNVDVCYRTGGDNPDKWRISLLRATTNTVDHLEVSLLEFLVEVLHGESPSKILSTPAFPGKKGFTWCPSGEHIKC
jgi:hypothetical protein